MFYGANGHYDYPQSIATQITGLQTMGMTNYRVTYEGNQTSLTYLQNLATALKGTGITMICCIDLSMCDSNNVLYVNEAAAFNAGYLEGATVAQALIPLGVTIFETGNELDAKNGIRIPVQAVQGGIIQDFDSSKFAAFKGVIKGCMAALRQYGGSSIQIASNAFTACSIAMSDYLWNAGIQWDITNWHNYEDYGLLSNMSMDYQKPNVNVWDHLMKYGKPILISEWNAKASDTDAQRAVWATTFLDDARNWNSLFPGSVLGVSVYQLYNGTPWGVLNGDNTVQQTFGQTVKNYIAAHPMN